MFRDLSFSERLVANRFLIKENYNNVPALLNLASTLRGLFFIPILYCIISRETSKLKWTTSISFVFLILPEVLLTGTRKPVFQLLALIIIAFIVTYGFRFLLSRKILVALCLSAVLLSVFSYVVLKKRITDSVENTINLTDLVNSKYNDFVPINTETLEKLKNAPENDIKSNIQFLGIHTGQYVVLGMYEFNNLIKTEELQYAKGSYTFVAISKLLVKLHLIDASYIETNYNPRQNTYLTAFGGLYLDFGWFAIIFFFLFGIFQKTLVKLANANNFFKVLLVYILFINLSLPIINTLRGGGLYPIAGFFLVLLAHEFYLKIKKSTRS